MAKTPVQDRSRVRVDRMLTTFGQLLDSQPYHQVTTTMVAKGSDSAVGSFYQFFRTKEELADALRERLSKVVVDTTKANLEAFMQDAVTNGGKTTLVDCFVALHHAMESVHRNQPGARHLPMKADQVAAELSEAFSPYSHHDLGLLYSYTLVAVSSSAACVKVALDNPDHSSDILALAQWNLQELAKEDS